MTTMRPYQTDCVEAVRDGWLDDVQRPAVVLATGTGKTVIMAEIVSRETRAGRRPTILVHRDELVAQTVEKLTAVDPSLNVGVVQADRHEIDAEVVVASVQSLVRRLDKGSRAVACNRFNFVLVDECHHAAAKSYVDILTHFGAMKADSGCRALGVTATMSRADGSALGHIWQKVVYKYGAPDAIADGWLVMPHAKRARLDVDLSGLKSHHGDYSDSDLGGRLIRHGARVAEVIIAEARNEHGHIRRGIVFTPTVECAEAWLWEFRDAGIRTEIVTGTTPRHVRREVYKATHEGRNDMILSVMVLTEGFDLPSVEVAVIGRPTKSLPLYTQMVGRVLRPSPATGKRNALILDVCGVMQDQLTTLADLHLPDPCECGCDCEFAYLCAKMCNCPRSRTGRLKRPCVACQPHGPTMDCATHYAGDHGLACTHQCPGAGRPGLHDEDPTETEPIQDLEGERPVIIDDTEIRTKDVQLFGTVKKRSPWLLTTTGVPFLPPTSTFEFVVWLHHEPDGTWSVGERQKDAKKIGVRLEAGLTFEEARIEALSSHPGQPRALIGEASRAQIAALWNAGVETPEGLTKQEASDLLTVAYVSRWLKR